jgi:hypothetical protein
MTTPSTARKAGPLLGNGSTTAFPFTFKVFAAADVAVTIANSSGVETPLVLNTDYSVTLNSNQDTSPGGTITYPISGAALPSGSKLSIVGDLDYDQPLDLPSGGNFSPIALENQLDRATMQIQQLKEEVDRAAQVPVTSNYSADQLSADLIRIADSADNLDTIAANIADVNTVADDLNEPVSEINTVATSIANVNTVGNNITNVNTVAGISANVTTVAGINANVTTVAGIAANVTAVAGNATNINTVAGNNANVTAVGANITNVNTVAANEVNIDTVAGIASNVSAVAAIDDAVSIAATNVADINNFADVYQGGKATDPTVRNDGSALQAGDLYFNTTLGRMRVRVFGVWDDAITNVGAFDVETFSGTGSQTAFTLGTDPLDKANCQVYISGVYQQKTKYSVLGTTLTFVTAPPSATDNIEVVISTPVAFGNLSTIQADVTVKSAAATASAAGASASAAAALVSEGNADASEAAALAAKVAAESARDAAQFHAGIYDTTALGIAATTSGQYFSVPGASNTVLSLYKNNAGSAVLVNSYPATQVARLGRVQFSRRGTTFLFNDPAGSSVEVGWTTLRLWKGESTYRRVADRALSALAAEQALYIDVATDVPPEGGNSYAVLQATTDSIAVDVVQGTKILLVANYFDGYLVGEIAEAFVNKEMQTATATAQTTATAAQTTATAAQTTATTAQTNALAGRRMIVGEITSTAYAGNSATVSISQGTVYKENNSGNPEKTIAPLTAVTLPQNQGIVVDLAAGALDGSGRVIPTVVAVASGAQTGWQSGNKYILVVNDGVRVHGLYRLSDSNAKAARRLIAGSVTRADWSGASVTVNISEGRAYKEANGGVPEKTIAPLNDQILDSNECLIVDLVNGSLDGSGRVIPVKLFVAQASAAGWQTADKYILAANGGLGILAGEYEPYIPAAPAASGYSPDEVVVIQRSDEVDVYMKGSNPDSSRYLRYRMQRKPDAAIGSDVWRWNEVWEVTRTGDFSFNTVIQICNSGENETAILQTGKPDFMGGTAHGDEILFEVAMLIDGTKVALGGTGNYRCRRVEFLQGSDMFEVGTATPQSNRLAKNYKRWLFESSAVELFQNVFWEASVTLQDTYMTMLTLLRTSGVTQISDKGYRHPKYTEENISTAGFTNIYDKTPIAKASGPSGFSAEVEILDGWDKPNREFNFSPSASYNKFYFDYTGPGYVTQIGEQFVARAVYRLDTKN